VAIRSSTWAFTFSTPASANTMGVIADGVTPRLAWTNTATLFTGANVSATWYHVVRKFGWRRPRLRVHPAKPKVGLRTRRADEMWHNDTTCSRLILSNSGRSGG
jgi:hypothetical protein